MVFLLQGSFSVIARQPTIYAGIPLTGIPLNEKTAERRKVHTFGSSTVLTCKTRRFPSPLHKGFGFIGMLLYMVSMNKMAKILAPKILSPFPAASRATQRMNTLPLGKIKDLHGKQSS